MDDNYPEIATLLATHLRQITRDDSIYARVILPTDRDNADPNGNPYISIGFCGERETELFELVQGQNGKWVLGQFVNYHGAYWEPPDTDIIEVVSSFSLSFMLDKMADMIVTDRLAAALESFEYELEQISGKNWANTMYDMFLDRSQR